ncbi:hypothetical protein [Sphingomonas sp. Leaf20]|uniref:hypothetical protein n=1 Tax=Sphingomonas sp. Leaf20 TaxID=1735685 RepID=UPI0012E2A337|nr:hypothetical protein [Sphingomonas sp. Leaf20]
MALTGCKTSGDIRERQVRAQSTSAKSVDVIAGCIALNAAPERGVEVSKADIPNGVSIAQSVRVAGVKSVVAVWDIEDLGTSRRVTLYVVNKSNRATSSIEGPAANCL